MQIAQNVLAGAHCNLQVLLIFEMVISIKKCMADQRGPHHGRHILGQVKASGLIIKMVAPACSAVPLGLIFNQPLQGELCLITPCLIAGTLREGE